MPSSSNHFSLNPSSFTAILSKKMGLNASRYGFNGKMKDNEVEGEGDVYDFGARIYDSRLGRFLSVDPFAQKYPELTTYQFASNSPIANIDLDGLEKFYYNYIVQKEGEKTQVFVVFDHMVEKEYNKETKKMEPIKGQTFIVTHPGGDRYSYKSYGEAMKDNGSLKNMTLEDKFKYYMDNKDSHDPKHNLNNPDDLWKPDAKSLIGNLVKKPIDNSDITPPAIQNCPCKNENELPLPSPSELGLNPKIQLAKSVPTKKDKTLIPNLVPNNLKPKIAEKK